MIVLWGLPGDRPLAAVRNVLRRWGCPVVFLDQHAVHETDVELSVGPTVKGTLWIRDQAVDLNTITALYPRLYDVRLLPCLKNEEPGSQAWQHALAVDDILMSWAELTSALVVNRPSAMAANSSKPYQLAWIRSFGFKVPETLMTTDPSAVLQFWQCYGTVIYKSMSGIRSIVTRLTPEDRERLENVVWCPTQFQRYISGIDYRVHVIGKEVFACTIVSEADDYRYAARKGKVATIQACELPEAIANLCKELAVAMDLQVIGVDLRCTPDGQWYCFEVNPSPGFTYFQQATKQPMDEAIAKLLGGHDIFSSQY